MMLAGDVGGTKTVLALVVPAEAGLRLVHEATFASGDYGSLEEVLAEFLGRHRAQEVVQAACVGVAGPVVDGKSDITNLGWHLEEAALASASGVRRVKLLNDLEATAYGMLFLEASDLLVLSGGTGIRRQGNVAVIAAGTGLGEATLFWNGKEYHPIASEGGHCDFAPRTDKEIELLRYLRRELGGHVSYERVLSGPGLYRLYRFLRASRSVPEPAWLTERLTLADPSASVAEAGLAGTDPVCVESLNLFASLYGAEAGNLALKCLALGGVFVGGGMAPKILPALKRNDTFVRAFTDKGRLTNLMKGITVSVALNPRTALLGAAHFSLRL